MAYEVLMPQLGLTMEEGTVSSWVKHEGDAVKAGDVLLEITTDKLTNEVTSEHDGVLLKIVAQEGEDIPVKGLLGYVGEAGEVVGDAAPAAPAAAAPPVADGKRVRISPLARKTAQKLGVDYTAIAGSGPSGRIRQADILTAAEAQKSALPRLLPLPRQHLPHRRRLPRSWRTATRPRSSPVCARSWRSVCCSPIRRFRPLRRTPASM